ncbi:hypothetical protein O7635_02385 [Asanoa sp. WMMD1127]|uniref:hypothetical protein n=1 Tax=Asanoa sp. WMMD1127 TaxID=3016107 RepID=UPI00241774EA|nr:hypothetical protein [Asanoa sp. WMMD1127]MDG4820698.1 hypothetical protein [Asanoa sp. WMMD1127]
MNSPTASADAPIYAVDQNGDWCQLVVDDGSRRRVIADGLTESTAHWLVTVLDRRPYAPG